jgi:hypothetical protein
MGKEISIGQMIANTMGSSMQIIFMVKVRNYVNVKDCMSGVMAESTKETGKIIKWMEGENSHGQITECILENTLMIKRKGWELLSGLMGEGMRANGKMGNNMDMQFIIHRREKEDRGYGKMENE